MTRVLFVCTANICRSPMAEVIAKARHAAVFSEVQSAGVNVGPRGEPIDARAAAALARHDYTPLKKFRSRRVRPADFERFDWIVVMEAQHLADLRAQCPEALQGKLRLLRTDGADVPDPYFGPAAGFDVVLRMIEQGVAEMA